MTCVATFYSHFGAIRFKKLCEGRGWPARVMPVPRDLSSSCGTCVRYRSDDAHPEAMDEDVEAVYELCGGTYRLLMENGE